MLEVMNRYRQHFIDQDFYQEKSVLQRDEKHHKQFIHLLNQHDFCFEKDSLPGHITGSAVILDKKLERIVLTHHKKLKMWIQLGGHSDGHPLTHEVALREGYEESGLKSLFFPEIDKLYCNTTQTPIPFDIDIHSIPVIGSMPEHLHYDMRYLIIADHEDLEISDESLDLKWFTLQEAKDLTADQESMQYLLNKVARFTLH